MIDTGQIAQVVTACAAVASYVGGALRLPDLAASACRTPRHSRRGQWR